MSARINPIVRFAVERRVTMGMAVLGVLVLGGLSLVRLPLEFLPSFSSSSISVSVPYASSSPREIERQIVRPLEDSLGTLNGLETLTATASATSANVNLSFVDGTDMNLAAVEVRDRVDRARPRLPGDVERIEIRRFQSSDIPVLRANLSASWDPDRLYYEVERVVLPRLERLEGVASVGVRGLRSRQLQVNLHPARLTALGVQARAVAAVLRENNLNLSGGAIREGSRRLLVRVVGELQSVEEIRRLPLNQQGLTLGDVAEVDYAFPEQEEFNFLNGSEALSLLVYKASNANLLAVVDRVKAELAAIQALPEAQGLDVHIFRDSSKDVREGLVELRNTGLVGGALAIFFMYLFLRRVRTTLLIAIAIPVSVVVTFVIMYLGRQLAAADFTLNIISLMGLILAIGMLVDNSIVVIESIYRHRSELGEDAHTAALHGASEVALPILAATATSICVFVPTIFLSGSGGGRFAVFLQTMAVTICVVLLASLLVALTVVPMVAAVLLEREVAPRRSFLDHITTLYGRLVRTTLRHRPLLIVLSVLLLGGSWYLYQGLQRSFGGQSFERELTLLVDLPKSYSQAQTQALYDEVYGLLDSHRAELEIENIAYGYRRGGGRSRGFSRNNRFEIFLVDDKVSQLDTGEIRQRLQLLLPERPGVTFTLDRSVRGRGGDGGGLEIELVGDDLQILERLSGDVMARLAALPMLRDVDSSLESGDQEIHVGVRRERALAAGMSSQQLAATISGALSSRPASHFKTRDREIDMVVQYRAADRQTLEQLQQLPAAFGDSPLSISSFADFSFEPSPRTIERQNRRAKIRITADTTSGMPSFALLRPISAALDSLPMPPGYQWSLGESARESNQEQSDALFTFLFALLLVYMVMAALFESFAQPFTIMFSVPFAFVGVGIVLRLTGQSLGQMTDMGLIILAGIVVNNAIVLIDRIDRLRQQGIERTQAIVLAGQHRLRPIVMTTATTILGLAPMVAPFFFPQWFGAIEGRAAFWAPVGLVILGGLTTSTVLTLVVIPTLYTLIDDVTRFARRLAAAA